MNFYRPEELELVEQEEHDAWRRLSEARDERRAAGHEVPPEEQDLLHKLSQEWHQALERLHAARSGRES